jgi:hypothetical protein
LRLVVKSLALGIAFFCSTAANSIAPDSALENGIDRCPTAKPSICSDYVNRFCVTIFFYRGRAEIDEPSITALINFISEEAKIRKPKLIEVTPYFMDHVASESEKLANKRAKNIIGALKDRDIGSKLMKRKPAVESCVAKNRQIEQRRVEVVFFEERIANE